MSCVACRHQIDAAARVCPYCGADPRSGQKAIDTQALLQQVFHPREQTRTEEMLQFARQRQGIVIAVGALVALLLLGALHQVATRRNSNTASESAGVPLTDVTDLTNQPSETKQLPMPDLKFQYDGRPQTMRTFIVETGAVTPPEVAAAQQPQQQPRPATPAPAGQQ